MDIFNHIGETRSEIIALPYYGWMRNPVETMIRYAMSTGKFSSWISKYPILKVMPIDDPLRLFNITMQYTTDSFFKTLVKYGTDNGLERKDVEKDFNEMIMLADPKYSSATMMDIVINRLLGEDFLQKLYIYSPVMTTAIKSSIVSNITVNTNKVFLTDKTIREIIEFNEDKLTTIFVEDTDMFMDVLQSYSKEERLKYMGNKYFILPAKSSLTENAKQMVQSMGILPEKDQFKYKDFINAMLGEVDSYADFLQLKMIKVR